MSKLTGKRVLVTRAPTDFEAFAQLLRQRGALPIPFPTIDSHPSDRTQEIDDCLDRLDQFDWLIFTSAKGVNALSALLANRTLPDMLRLAAVGPKTAEAIQQQGWKADYIPNEYRGIAILSGLGKVTGKRFLLARGQLAAEDLPNAIRASGGEVTELVVYHTRPHTPSHREMATLQRGVDVITFTSASIVDNFVAVVRAAGLDPVNLPGDPLFAYIGPVTAEAAYAHGLPEHVIADNHTLEGLISALEDFLAMKVVQIPYEQD